jgi:hypothetical protein
MRLVAFAVSMFFLLAAPGAEAWPGKRKLPRPVDSPIVRPKVQEHHKAGKRRGRHNEAYYRPGWGEEKTVYKSKRGSPQIKDYLFQTE